MTLCLHLPLSLDRLTRVNPLSEGGRKPFVKMYTRFFHGSESILPRPVAIMNRRWRVHKFFQMIQEYRLRKTSLATTRRVHDQNTRGCFEPKRFSPLYSARYPRVAFGRKCDLWHFLLCLFFFDNYVSRPALIEVFHFLNVLILGSCLFVISLLVTEMLFPSLFHLETHSPF